MMNAVLESWKNSSGDSLDPLFSIAPICMHSINANYEIVQASTFWAERLGYDVSEMLGRKSTDFLTPSSADYAKNVVLPRFFETGSIYNIEYDFVRKNGEILPVLMSAIAQYDKNGKFLRSLAIMFDNSEAKRISAKLLQSQRTEAVGRLVGGVAHDFNNLLTVILGNIEFLRQDFDAPDRETLLESAYAAAQRGSTLTQQLLAYGRKAHLRPEIINLNQVMADMDAMLKRLLPATIQIETEPMPGLWQTEIDRHLLDTAILNIVNNARDAMPQTGGILTLKTRNIRVTEDRADHHHDKIAPGRYVMIAISDNGTGMSKDTLAQAFEPFFTTKTVGKGSGLGLSMIYGFMQQSNGAIRVHSEVGKGTTFMLYFPASTRNTKAEEDTNWVYLLDDETDQPDTQIEMMVVEDEPDVQKVILRQLRGLDLNISHAASGDEAYTRLASGYRPDILLTDIVMPGVLQGPDLVKRAREFKPDIQVVLISGYPKEHAVADKVSGNQDMQFVKPVDSKILASAINVLADKVRRSRGS